MLNALLATSCQSGHDVEFDRYYSAGSSIYQAHCQNCHGHNGEGLNGLIPPLTDSVFLKTNKAQLSCYLQYGLKGKIKLSTNEYEGQMPAADLAPVDLAKVITYITNSFGNKQNTTTVEMVEAQLNNCGSAGK